MSYQALGKYKVLTDSQLTFPHKCAGCGAWSGTFIDTGLDIEFYGEVYICSNCFIEMANQLDYRSPIQYEKAERTAARLLVTNDEYRTKIEELENALGSYSRLFPDNPASSGTGKLFIVREGEEPESDPGDGSTDSDGEEGLDESDDESGSSDLPDSDNDSLSKLLDI